MKGKVSEKAFLNEGSFFYFFIRGPIMGKYEGEGFGKSGRRGEVVFYQGFHSIQRHQISA